MSVKIFFGLSILLLAINPLFAEQSTYQATLADRPTAEKTYAELASKRMDARRNVYRSQEWEVRRDLWILHHEKYLNSHPALTDEQKSVLFESIGILTSGILDAGADNDLARRALHELDLQARVAFTQDELFRAFQQLGGEEPLSTASVLQLTTNGPGDLPDCECSSVEDLCWWGYHCNASYMSCIKMAIGCGWYWIQPCNGLCF